MGVCYTLYCKDCKMKFDLGKENGARCYIPRILKLHAGHNLDLFNDCISCAREFELKTYNNIDMAWFEDMEDTEKYTTEQFYDFAKNNSKCTGCTECF